MEQVSGHSLRTRQDIDRYLQFLNEVRPQKEPGTWLVTGLVVLKRLVLIALMAFAAFQYLAVGVVTEVLSVDKVKFLTPPPLPRITST